MKKTKYRNLCFIYSSMIIFYFINHASALQFKEYHKSNNYFISESFIDSFCNEKESIILKDINYCEKLFDIQKIKDKKNFYDYFDFLSVNGDNRFSEKSKINVFFDHDGKIVSSEVFFQDDYLGYYEKYSLFIVEDVIILFYQSIIEDFQKHKKNKKIKENLKLFEDFTRTYFYHAIVMDKKGNYKIYYSKDIYIQKISYKYFKEDFDWYINFLRKELPIKVKY